MRRVEWLVRLWRNSFVDEVVKPMTLITIVLTAVMVPAVLLINSCAASAGQRACVLTCEALAAVKVARTAYGCVCERGAARFVITEGGRVSEVPR